MKKSVYFVFLIISLMFISLASADDYALDVKIYKPIYSAGENLTYQVILLKNGVPYSDTVKVFISDIENKKLLDFNVITNNQNSLYIDKDFSSGYWKIETSYNDQTVKRFFTVGERQSADFSIDGDTLIIKNTGNVPYTKTIQILIGEKVISQDEYIDIGQYKEIKLVAPNGNYDIQVTDGVNTISKQNVYLAGTGRVIGALDQQILNNQPVIGGARDPTNQDTIFSAKNFSVAFIFIGAVFGLFLLLTVERLMQKRRASMAKNIVKLH